MVFLINRRMKFKILSILTITLISYTFLYYNQIASNKLIVLNDLIHFDTLNEFDTYVNNYCPVEELNVTVTCLEMLSNYTKTVKIIDNNDDTDIIYYHTFWEIKKPNELDHRMIKLNLLSYLATQDLSRTKFLLWTLKEASLTHEFQNELKNDFDIYFQKDILKLMTLNFDELCSNGVFQEYYKLCKHASSNPHGSVGFSDFVRLLILNKYGGIYTDGDVMYLRDMKPFWQKNFVYRWSILENYNTAIMGISVKSQNDEFKNEFYRILTWNAKKHNFVNGFHPFKLKNVIYNINKGEIFHSSQLKVYHSALFDPAWLCNDKKMKWESNKTVCKFSDFYDIDISSREFEFRNFFNGAFTYHLHKANCGTCIIKSNSYFYQFELYFKSLLPK